MTKVVRVFLGKGTNAEASNLLVAIIAQCTPRPQLAGRKENHKARRSRHSLILWWACTIRIRAYAGELHMEQLPPNECCQDKA